MKVVFDASTLISISQTCLINILGSLQRKMDAEFIIPKSVYYEAVERPIFIKRFELNAVRIKKAISDGAFKIVSVEDKKLFDEIAEIANNCFFVKDKPIKLLQRGEIEALAIIKEVGAEAIAIDERTTRMLIENPRPLQKVLQSRKRIKIRLDKRNVDLLGVMFNGLSIVRSVELVALANEYGLLQEELPPGPQSLEAALFAAKYSGCAVSSREISIFLHGERIKKHGE